MLSLSLSESLHLVLTLFALTAGSTGVSIADVTIDACIAQNSNTHPTIAADMQSLCALCSSVGAPLGFSISGILVHLIGPKAVFGLLIISFGLVWLAGIVLDEPHLPDFNYREVLNFCTFLVEGTFFALLMSIDNVGVLTSSWSGGLLLHVLKVTRTKFDNLWLAIVVRNFLRVSPLCLLFLIPRGDPVPTILQADVSGKRTVRDNYEEDDNIELVSLVRNVEDN